MPKDTAWHHLCVLRQTFETYGCPLAYYTDNHIIFRNQTETRTQFSRALAAFHITLKFSERTPLDLIFALHYPRALKKDGTLAFGGKIWQIPNAPRYGLVTVVLKPPTTRRPHTEISVIYKGSTLAHFVLSKTQPPSST